MMKNGELVKHAGKLVTDTGLDHNEFPELLIHLKKSAMRYHLRSESIGIYNLADIVSSDLELLAILIDSLEFNYKKKKVK